MANIVNEYYSEDIFQLIDETNDTKLRRSQRIQEQSLRTSTPRPLENSKYIEDDEISPHQKNFHSSQNKETKKRTKNKLSETPDFTEFLKISQESANIIKQSESINGSNIIENEKACAKLNKDLWKLISKRSQEMEKAIANKVPKTNVITEYNAAAEQPEINLAIEELRAIKMFNRAQAVQDKLANSFNLKSDTEAHTIQEQSAYSENLLTKTPFNVLSPKSGIKSNLKEKVYRESKQRGRKRKSLNKMKSGSTLKTKKKLAAATPTTSKSAQPTIAKRKIKTTKKSNQPKNRNRNTSKLNAFKINEELPLVEYVRPKVLRYYNSGTKVVDNANGTSLLPAIYPSHFTKQIPAKELNTACAEKYLPHFLSPWPGTFPTPEDSQQIPLCSLKNEEPPITPTLSPSSLCNSFELDEIFDIMNNRKVTYRLTDQHIEALAVALKIDVNDLHSKLDGIVQNNFQDLENNKRSRSDISRIHLHNFIDTKIE